LVNKEKNHTQTLQLMFIEQYKTPSPTYSALPLYILWHFYDNWL